MQRSLCQVAQSQGDFAVKTTKLQLPSCSWFYIKSSLACEGIQSVPAVRYTQPKSILPCWGLTLYSCPHVGSLDVIRFDIKEKMDGFRRLFGIMTGFGVRKKQPKYRDGKSFLSLNDVLNVISCPSQQEKDSDERRDTTGFVDHGPFKRFGATDDGIDLAYDASEGVLQIVLRYRKMVVTNTSIGDLASVGVATGADKAGTSSSLQNLPSDTSKGAKTKYHS
jgi:hypothetical protein